jgi:hypothetical protein
MDSATNHRATPEQWEAVQTLAGGLVERVGAAMESHYVMGDIQGSWDAQARAAIREVAAWLDSNAGLPDAATPREEEGGQ